MLSTSQIIRAFFGIPIPEDCAQHWRKLLLKAEPQLNQQPLRWTRSGNHHVTLRFLGNIAKQKITPLIDAVTEATAVFQPFEIKLSNITAFPNQTGRMVAANIQLSSILYSLYSAIDLVVTSNGFPTETHPYLPHITLFRFKNKKNTFHHKIPLGSESISVKEFILYQSVAIEKGSLYVPIHKFSL